MYVGHAMTWETFVNGRFMLGENYAGCFARGELLSRVSTVDEPCPSHIHICHSVKFERNLTIHGRVMAI